MPSRAAAFSICPPIRQIWCAHHLVNQRSVMVGSSSTVPALPRNHQEHQVGSYTLLVDKTLCIVTHNLPPINRNGVVGSWGRIHKHGLPLSKPSPYPRQLCIDPPKPEFMIGEYGISQFYSISGETLQYRLRDVRAVR
jgi:hypothetical protein